MTRIPGGKPPSTPPSPAMTAQRILYLERARLYFNQLSKDLDAGLTAEGLTLPALRQHWNARVRPADHSWIQGNELTIRHLAQGHLNAAQSSAQQQFGYLRRQGIGDLTQVRRDQPTEFAAACGALLWGGLAVGKDWSSGLTSVMYTPKEASTPHPGTGCINHTCKRSYGPSPPDNLLSFYSVRA